MDKQKTAPAKDKMPVEEKTTIDDITICLFCNFKNESITDNLKHMIDEHKFTVPMLSCLKNVKGLIQVIAKKIFTYKACVTCDIQTFNTYKSLQNHMVRLIF